MFLATDANPDALLEIASRAARKPARGGVPNLICIAEPVEALSGELAGIADRITAILPWGSLLRALVQPETAFLHRLHRLCASEASLEIVFSYDQERDASEQGPLGAAGVQESYVRNVLPALYEAAGFRITGTDRISRSELSAYETSWAKRLAFGHPREVWRLRAAKS